MLTAMETQHLPLDEEDSFEAATRAEPLPNPPAKEMAKPESHETPARPLLDTTEKTGRPDEAAVPEPKIKPDVQVQPTSPSTEHAPSNEPKIVDGKTTSTVSSTPADSTKAPLAPALVREQLSFCANVLRGLKRHRDHHPFAAPVDPEALGIPDYFSVIKNPMDLSIISKKLDAGEYKEPESFAADVRLMLSNCFAYNHAESQVHQMGRNLEKYFESFWTKLPTELRPASSNDSEESPLGKRRRSEGPGTPASTPRARRDTGGSVRRNSTVGRPPGSTNRSSMAEYNFCQALYRELTKKSNLVYSWPFALPVDPVALGIPDYLDVIKNPMDLSTIKRKLDTRQYSGLQDFEADVRLMFANCYLYNAPDTDVVKLARSLEAIFDAKLSQRPAPGASHTHDGSEGDMDAEQRILELSQQIQSLQNELNGLLMQRRNKTQQRQTPAPKPKPKSTSAAAATPSAHAIDENRPMTFEEKRQLSVDVNNLPSERLGRVVEIIHNSMPHLRDSADSDVIELDIESLDARTLRMLQNYVRDCNRKKAAAPKKPKLAEQPLHAHSQSGPHQPEQTGHGSATTTSQMAPPQTMSASSSDDSGSSSDDE